MAFANPWGLLALLALPAIVALHLLRHRRRQFVAPALFLLPRQAPSSLAGPRLESFRRSIPLWLQLLIALIFTWLLAGPRWDSSRQLARVVVVLDSSASMQTSAAKIRKQLPGALLDPELGEPEIVLLSSDLGEGQLHRGSNRAELEAALADWQPWGAAPDLAAALEVARALAGDGALLLVTDHAPELALPAECGWVSWAEPVANVGLVGATVEPGTDTGPARWRALVRNYADTPQARTWSLQDGASGELVLDPGALQLIEGELEADGPAVLELEGDAFPADNRILLIEPEPKTLRVHRDPATPAWMTRLLGLLPGLVEAPPAEADLLLLPVDSGTVVAPGQAVVSWSGGSHLPDEVVDSLPLGLAEGLDFGGLLPLVPETAPTDLSDRSGQSLAWAGDRPLIQLDEEDGAGELHLAFDPAAGNAGRMPALAVLLSRFVEKVRAPLPRSSTARRGGGERLDYPLPGPLAWRFEPLEPGNSVRERELGPDQLLAGLELPAQPGLLTLTGTAVDRDDEAPVYRAAIHFAEFAEADLGNLIGQPLPKLQPARLDEFTRRDPAAPWLLATLVLLLPLCWWFDRPS